MKRNFLMKQCLTLLTVALLLAGVGCSLAERTSSDKIPVTTASDEARQNYLQGQELLENLEVTDARGFFEKAVAADPNFALGHLRLANTATSPESFLEAVAKAKALSDQVSDGERLWILALDAGARARSAEANELFQRLVAAYPNDERAHFLLGGSYFGLQQWGEAVAEYRKANAINPNYAAPYNQMGYALRFSGNNEEAAKAFQKYIELIPNNPNPHDSYAELLLSLGRHEESIAAYRKALSIDPHFMASYIGIATNLNLQGKYKDARAELETMRENTRNDGERRAVHFAMVVSYADQGRLDKAIEEMRALHAIAEQNGNTIQMAQDLNGIAYLQLEAGKIKDAQQNYEKSVTMREEADIPDSAKAQANRNRHSNGVLVALKKGDLEAAKSHAEQFRALAEATGSPSQMRLYHERAGMIALAEKGYDKALEELQQANQLDPYNLYRLAVAYQGKGDKENAKQLCQRLDGLNSLNNLNYALVRKKASRLMASL